MVRRRKTAAPGKPRRNPIARALRSPLFHEKAAKGPERPRRPARKPKHPKRLDEDAGSD